MSLVDLGKKLLEYAKRGETEEVRSLMSNGAPFTTDWLGTSPLHMAAQFGHVKTAEVLLRAGISRDARTKVDRTPLHIAAQEGHLDIVQMLINHGAEIDAKDMLQMTPLHWAVERGHVPVINCLLSHNSDTQACSKFNKTPLDIAKVNCRTDIMQILKEHAVTHEKNLQEVGPKKMPIKMLARGHRLILPKPQAMLPVNIVKKGSLADIKDIVSRAVVTKRDHNSSRNTDVTACTSAKILKSTPVIFHSNASKDETADPCKRIKLSSINSDHGDALEQSCTNVLATLAALAEATAPNATISTQEALHWLEVNGITMLPSDNSTLVAAALEGGQSVALTEAGKLALTWVKEQRESNNSSCNESATQDKTSSKAAFSTNKHVIRIVADRSQIPSIISKTPIVVVGQTTNCGERPPPVKKIKIRKEIQQHSNEKLHCSTDEDERLLLQKELEKMKKEAAQYKAQLIRKEHEAEQYRKQLEKLKST